MYNEILLSFSKIGSFVNTKTRGLEISENVKHYIAGFWLKFTDKNADLDTHRQSNLTSALCYAAPLLTRLKIG